LTRILIEICSSGRYKKTFQIYYIFIFSNIVCLSWKWVIFFVLIGCFRFFSFIHLIFKKRHMFDCISKTVRHWTDWPSLKNKLVKAKNEQERVFALINEDCVSELRVDRANQSNSSTITRLEAMTRKEHELKQMLLGLVPLYAISYHECLSKFLERGLTQFAVLKMLLVA